MATPNNKENAQYFKGQEIRKRDARRCREVIQEIKKRVQCTPSQTWLMIDGGDAAQNLQGALKKPIKNGMT